MSYVHFDDTHDGGQLSAFRERLAAEVQAQTGREFVIFQDRADIAWGENWEQRIEESLDVVTLLVVMITPGFFWSPACRGEVSRFLERERVLGRSDLILPVYYISAREMDDPVARESDWMARVLASRQYADWRKLRFEPLTSPVVREAIAQLASRMRDTFWHPGPLRARPIDSRRQQAEVVAETAEQPSSQGRGMIKIEPPTHVVDAWHRGDFYTVSEAIRKAKPGDRILVRPGLYEEGLVVDKPLEIVGDGPVAEIEIRARGASALVFRTNIGRVANLTLRQAGGKGGWYGVDLIQGRLDLEGCDISSQDLACVAIRDGADPRLRRNHIHDGKDVGVYVCDGGLGTLEDNDISANTRAGVEIKTGGNPTLRRRNQIRDNKANGVLVYDGGLGTLEDNDISANTRAGVVIRNGGNPTLRRNQIHHNKANGVLVYHDGLGTLEDNDINDNARAGVEIRDESNPTLRRNQIHHNELSGIFVHDYGLGTLEDNDINDNARAGAVITTGGNPTLRRNRVNRNGFEAAQIYNGGWGVLEDNDLTGNTRGAWNIADDCRVNATRARNKE